MEFQGKAEGVLRLCETGVGGVDLFDDHLCGGRPAWLPGLAFSAI